jgi:16S rRNA (cytidine1402-2'-O)-methyltransferase
MPAAPDRAGTLYVVATPIGNLADLAPRAREVLERADLVLAEDTRHSGALLRHFGIDRPLLSLHEHNESDRIADVIARLHRGDQIALVSDAGTPLVSDPGYRLLAAVRAERLRASPVPGPCAAIAALCVCGLATDRFAFEGFLPPKRAARRARLEALRAESRTLVFYEAGRRLTALLEDIVDVFGSDRRATLARELTKLYEEIAHGSVAELAERSRNDASATRGELVLVVEGAASEISADRVDGDALLRVLVEELPPGQAASIAARLTGRSRNALYAQALALGAAARGRDES